MIKHIVPAFVFCLLSLTGYAQQDSLKNSIPGIFEKIAAGIKDYKLDTSAAPNDKLTKKIIELRDLRGGFNINEAIEFKIAEDRQKNEVPKEELDKLANYFKSGNGKRWLDNAIVWIYRYHFTYPEVKQLVKFYRTTAGQKMASDFPVIMLKSLRAGEMIKDMYAQQQKK